MRRFYLSGFSKFRATFLGQPIGKIEVMCITIKFICEKALEIASGLDFLASKNVVHGDLAARIGFLHFLPFRFYKA